MMINEGHVSNNGIKIHYVKSGIESKKTPLLIIPGIVESAEDYIEIIKEFHSRICIAISLRGRGKSDVPLTGYTLSDHISDIEAVVDELQLHEYILVGYSRGVSYALGYGIKDVDSLKGLVLCDYPAVHTELPNQFPEYFIDLKPWRGKAITDRISLSTLRGIQCDSEYYSFYKELNDIKIPVLIIGGGKDGCVLNQEIIDFYSKHLENLDVIIFDESDHNIFKPDPNQFTNAVKEYIDKL